MKNNALGITSYQRRWTKSSIDCYKRGCVCKGCFYDDFFKNSTQSCKMKASVIELVKVLGKPEIKD